MNSDDILVERFGEMPKDIQDLVLSERFKQDVHTIAQKYDLLDQKESALAAEIVMAIFGITDIREFPRRLVEKTSFDSERIENIVSEIDQTIFSQIRASLNQVQGLGERNAPQASPQKEEGPVTSPNPQSSQKPQQDIGNKRRPGKQPDPYREPIDNE